jgi:uncharacterized protein
VTPTPRRKKAAKAKRSVSKRKAATKPKRRAPAKSKRRAKHSVAQTIAISHEAVASSFITRQWLDQPRGRELTAEHLAGFAESVGGVQIDSINVLDRAHHLTLWSRFGPYDRAALHRLLYEERVLFEYWSHAACFVPRAHGPAWRRAMLDYRARHQGWGKWLRTNRRTLAVVEAAVRDAGPIGSGDIREKRPKGAGGWWSWKPATFAFHFLWMSGRLAVFDRVHFQKRFDLVERVLPDLAAAEPPAWDEFVRWHIKQSLRAMGAATEQDLRMYLSYPRMPVPSRRRAIDAMRRAGELVDVTVEGSHARWLALAEDLPTLAAAGSASPHRGTTLLAPFDSLLWHRERVRALFGYDYRIEVYTPQAKRVLGYYTLPIFHDGRLIGRIDAKNHRGMAWLEVRHAHFEPWFAAGKRAPVPGGTSLDRGAALAGVAESIASLAEFTHAQRVSCARVTPAALAAPLRRAIRAAAPTAPRAAPAALANTVPAGAGDVSDEDPDGP